MDANGVMAADIVCECLEVSVGQVRDETPELGCVE